MMPNVWFCCYVCEYVSSFDSEFRQINLGCSYLPGKEVRGKGMGGRSVKTISSAAVLGRIFSSVIPVLFLLFDSMTELLYQQRVACRCGSSLTR